MKRQNLTFVSCEILLERPHTELRFDSALIGIPADVVVVFLFFPKEDLFKFEYQLNRPWKHDKLIAPFDLGIRKTDEQITDEQAELASAQPPVFSISLTSEQSILTRMDDAWEVSTDSALTCDSLRASSMQFVADVLKRGVIQQGPTTKELTPHDGIMIDRGGTVQQMDYGDAFLLTEVMDSMQVLIDSLPDGPCKTAFADIIRDNIASNAIYNDSLTQKLIKGSYEGILTIEGKINRGQEIIDRGEIINDQRLQSPGKSQKGIRRAHDFKDRFSVVRW